MKPESDFSKYKDSTVITTHPPTVAWSRVLDCRYGMEVKRLEPYKGMYCIFDLDNLEELIFSEEVNISYDAKFGPDVSDASTWSDRGIEIVDNI